MRYRLRTLLILLAVLPPLLWIGWTKYEAWRAERKRQRAILDAKIRFAALMQANAPALPGQMRKQARASAVRQAIEAEKARQEQFRASIEQVPPPNSPPPLRRPSE
jgi:hypothetical protein